MSEQLKEESQKTVVSFVVGLLVGGLLVWAFTGNSSEAPKKEMKDDKSEMTTDEEVATQEEVGTDEEETTTVPVGEGSVSVDGDAAGMSVSLANVTFPAEEGWVGVRNLNEGKLGMILGVARFSAEQGLNPKEIQLLTPTVSGREYAIVFYSESGDRKFNLAEDVQLEGEFATFTAK
ncbi:hypothetical protein K2P47_00395 [Patescibacteria group bacterium]|nr:hypothetical protein [Patescibacteria group bacterium]